MKLKFIIIGAIFSFFSCFNIQLRRIFPRPFVRFGLYGDNLVGAEIGVYKGINAKSMFKSGKVDKLYLIDPYEFYEGRMSMMNSLSKAKEKALNLLRDKNVEFIYKKSRDAVIDIPNDLDFVYIDGAHDYKNVQKDIKNYWKKIKVGGVIGGHDMSNGRGGGNNGVIKAVTEFAVSNNLKLYIEYPDWWIYKRGKDKLKK